MIRRLKAGQYGLYSRKAKTASAASPPAMRHRPAQTTFPVTGVKYSFR